MATEPPGDADTARAKAAATVRTHPLTAIAWALVSIADTLVSIQRDVHKIAGRR
jgi:hypothetical protein